MAEIPFKVKFIYQADEEIMQTVFYYLYDGPIDDVGKSQFLAQECATNFHARRAQLANILGNHCYVIACEVTSPVVEGIGPAYFADNFSIVGAIDGIPMTDQVVMLVNVTGQNELDAPVRNTKLISGLMKQNVDCNLLDPTFVDNANAALAVLLPATLNLSNGQLSHVVRNDRGGGVVTYHPVQSINVGGIVGSYGTRRGDITPRRGKLLPTP